MSRNKNDKILKVKKDKLKKMRKLQHTCLNCGIEFEDEKNENRKFCSISCSSLFKKRENIRKWINNLFEPKSSSIRKYYLEYRNESLKCDVCNNIEWQGKLIPLEIDHIDGDAENNQIHNLRLICPNCHAQTKTYKGKNRGRGRYKRRERYQSGKSY